MLIGAVYGIVRWSNEGRVQGAVVVLDQELGGRTPEEAVGVLLDLEEQLASHPINVVIEGRETALLPAQAGFDLHEEEVVAEAMSLGRSDNPLADFFWWVGHIGRTTEILPTGELDSPALEEILNGYDHSIVGEPPFEGAIELQEGEPVARYPRAGRRIDRTTAGERLLGESLRLDRRPVELTVREEQPELTNSDVDAALSEASLMLSAPVVLTVEDGTSLSFTVSDLQQAFVATTHEDPARIDLGFDIEVLEARLAEVRSEFEAEPVDARFEISGYEVSVVPGRNGTRIDAEETADVLASAARTAGRRAQLPLREGAEPERTTQELEALDIRHLVSQFTTYHGCCEDRVTNIHLIADTVDGAIVGPGQTFSLNDYVGQRTEEKGYLPAGTIVGGEIVDTVGGGVSQFATTFYNAVFWGGYEDVEHKPHSFYYDRYPEGIEATISWPLPDLVFGNNDDSGVLIKTEYTDTSITVKFYGNNEGRILAGEQSGGQMSVGVVDAGGEGAKEVRGDRSDRYDFRSAPEPEYRPNPDLDVDASRQVQGARDGWTVLVTRTMTIGDEEIVQEWPVRYVPQQEIIEVHPCQVPGTSESCPTTTTTSTTTTTQPEETTTTTTPATTTTAPEETTTTSPPGNG